MLNLIQVLLDSGFMPHGHCYQWRTELLLLHAGSDALIGLSYFTIPLVLGYFLQRRPDVEFRWMFVMFAAFIFLCGATHFISIWTIWKGTYFLSGGIKLVTGAVSAATAFMLFAVVPRALRIPSPQQLELANQELRREVETRRAAEAALRESEERFRQAFDHAAIGKALVGPEGGWLQVNQALCDITGYSLEELLGMTFQEITYSEDLDESITLMHKLHEGEIDTFNVEKRYVHKLGHVVWVFLNVSAVRHESGSVKYFISEMVDITPRKLWGEEQVRLLSHVEAERDKLRRAESALEDANRSLEHQNRELQEFAYIASHDLKEPLRKISAFVDLVRSESGELLNEQASIYLNRVQEAAIRMAGLLSDLLEYSGINTNAEQFRQVDIGLVLAEVLADLELVIDECDAEIHAEPLPTIEADPSQIRQLLHHLISNALKYRRDDVSPVITIGCELSDTSAVCRITVSDNGLGFDQKYASRIFMPYERLHGRRYAGTGMGLTICRRIIERHRGAISAASKVGEGTEIEVILPIQHVRRAKLTDQAAGTSEKSLN